MNNKLLIACAGAGKTSHLINEALKLNNKKILITTFTDENTENIKNKIIKINGAIPSNITIQPWFSFLIEHGIKPFQGTLIKEEIKGLLLVSGKSGLKYITKDKRPVYYAESDIKNHYFSPKMEIFSDKIAKFAIKCNYINQGAVLSRLKTLYNYIFIDEIQDMAGYDFQFIEELMLSGINLLMVGDPRQSTFTTHYDSKYKKYSGFQMKDFFYDNCEQLCMIDEKSLNISHRCNEDIIQIANLIYPDLLPSKTDFNQVGILNGVYFVLENDVEKLFKYLNPTIIRYNIKYYNGSKNSYNIGKSKGLEFDYTLLYLTSDMIKWFLNPILLKDKTKSDLYIALTRAKFACIIVVKEIYLNKKLQKYNFNNIELFKIL